MAITAGGLSFLTLPHFSCQSDLQYDEALAWPHRLSQIWDTETIQDIGMHFREQFPGQAKERSLVKKLLANDDLADNGQLSTALDQQILEDFATDQTVMLDGWMLAMTEARQCALSTFTPAK